MIDDALSGTNGTNGTVAEPVPAEPKRKRPVFTDEHLRCIEEELMRVAWQRDKFYNERREILAMLHTYFGPRP